ATLCAPQERWSALQLPERARQMARQGVPMPALAEFTVADPETHVPVPRDATTVGEVMLRGNTVMKGYLKNEPATTAAFRGGWYHTGDLAVWHPDNYIEVKDRAKDIIISGGENISSLEIEDCLYRHPQVMEAAVVARPDEKWGETPCAFVLLKPDAAGVTELELIAWCREHLAHFKTPRTIVFGALPKTSTGKIQKFVLCDHRGSGRSGARRRSCASIARARLSWSMRAAATSVLMTTAASPGAPPSWPRSNSHCPGSLSSLSIGCDSSSARPYCR